MLHVPINEWGLVLYSTADGTRPVAGFGAAVTPGNNAYGSYVSLIAGASLTDDAYEIEILVNNVGIAATARDCVVQLGIDPAGGSSFTALADLVCGPATVHNAIGSGTHFRFPLFFKAGTSIGVAAAVNSATLTAINVCCQVKCKPSRPDLVPVGKYIDQFGVTLASSAGTAITEGTASEGAYTQLGSALTRPIWWWEFGYGITNAAMAANLSHVDIAIGSAGAKKTVIANAPASVSGNEQLSKPYAGSYGLGAVGDLVYGRSQCAAANTGVSLAAYGVGG